MKKESLSFGCTAQPFGFGAISRIAALEGGIHADDRGKNAQFHMVDHPQFASFFAEMKGRVTVLPKNGGSLESLFARPEFKSVDGIISSYDSAAAFYGWFNGTPVFLYDGLFWFWDFERHKGNIPGVMDELGSIKRSRDEKGLVQIYDKWAAEDYHMTMLLAHGLSTHSYVRRALNTNSRLGNFREFAEKTTLVGAMMDSNEIAEDEIARDHILVSLAGSIAPTVPFEKNLSYATSALSFVTDEAIKGGKNIPWIFVCHPIVYNALRDKGAFSNLPTNVKVRPSVGYHESQRLVAKADAMFVSPGLSFIEEAAYYKKPVFLLPEQNGGQPKNFNMLERTGYATETNLCVTDHMYGGCPLGEYDVDKIYDGVRGIWSDKMRTVRDQTTADFFRVIGNPVTRESFIKRQHDAVRRLVGDFDAVPAIANDILTRIHATV